MQFLWSRFCNIFLLKFKFSAPALPITLVNFTFSLFTFCNLQPIVSLFLSLSFPLSSSAKHSTAEVASSHYDYDVITQPSSAKHGTAEVASSPYYYDVITHPSSAKHSTAKVASSPLGYDVITQQVRYRHRTLAFYLKYRGGT